LNPIAVLETIGAVSSILSIADIALNRLNIASTAENTELIDENIIKLSKQVRNMKERGSRKFLMLVISTAFKTGLYL